MYTYKYVNIHIYIYLLYQHACVYKDVNTHIHIYILCVYSVYLGGSFVLLMSSCSPVPDYGTFGPSFLPRGKCFFFQARKTYTSCSRDYRLLASWCLVLIFPQASFGKSCGVPVGGKLGSLDWMNEKNISFCLKVLPHGTKKTDRFRCLEKSLIYVCIYIIYLTAAVNQIYRYLSIVELN